MPSNVNDIETKLRSWQIFHVEAKQTLFIPEFKNIEAQQTLHIQELKKI
jgi:hypothetical protein